jgi:hypothetical protein
MPLLDQWIERDAAFGLGHRFTTERFGNHSPPAGHLTLTSAALSLRCARLTRFAAPSMIVGLLRRISIAR